MENIKQELYKYCQNYIQERISNTAHAIKAAQESANDETKSSSGDKYETGRAMMQLEIEKNMVQLSGSLKLKNNLDQINIKNRTESVQPGSIVVTDNEIFFIAISIGKVIIHSRSFVILSPESPLGIKFMGLKSGDSFTFKDRRYVVKEIM